MGQWTAEMRHRLQNNLDPVALINSPKSAEWAKKGVLGRVGESGKKEERKRKRKIGDGMHKVERHQQLHGDGGATAK